MTQRMIKTSSKAKKRDFNYDSSEDLYYDEVFFIFDPGMCVNCQHE